MIFLQNTVAELSHALVYMGQGLDDLKDALPQMIQSGGVDVNNTDRTGVDDDGADNYDDERTTPLEPIEVTMQYGRSLFSSSTGKFQEHGKSLEPTESSRGIAVGTIGP